MTLKDYYWQKQEVLKGMDMLTGVRIAFALSVMTLVLLPGYAEFKLDPQYRKAVECGAETRIEVHVVDDDGLPVQGAVVNAVFAFKDGEWTGSCVSGSNGVAFVEGTTTGHYVDLQLSKNGYYDSRVKYTVLFLRKR